MSWGYDLLVNAGKSLANYRRIQYALSNTNVLLDDSNAVSEKAAQFKFPKKRIVTFPWGVDLTAFHPRSQAGRSMDSPRFVLLSTRGLEKPYGCDLIVGAFIKAAHVLPGLELIMLGDGSQRDQLMKEISSAGLSERVKFLGAVPENKILSYFHCSDLYISASHSDGSSVSLLQAMACALPSSVSDIPGNREWITAGQNGWLFNDGNVEMLAERILQAAKEPELCKRYGAASRVVVEKRANWQVNNTRLLDAYRMAFDLQKTAVNLYDK